MKRVLVASWKLRSGATLVTPSSRKSTAARDAGQLFRQRVRRIFPFAGVHRERPAFACASAAYRSVQSPHCEPTTALPHRMKWPPVRFRRLGGKQPIGLALIREERNTDRCAPRACPVVAQFRNSASPLRCSFIGEDWTQRGSKVAFHTCQMQKSEHRDEWLSFVPQAAIRCASELGIPTRMKLMRRRSLICHPRIAAWNDDFMTGRSAVS